MKVARGESSGLRRRVGLLPGVAAAVLALSPACGERPGHADVDRAGPTVTNTEVAYAFDPADTRKLVAFSDNVFVGRVVAQTGTTQVRTTSAHMRLAESQFSVLVVRNIKGRLRGRVAVNQLGGVVQRERRRGEKGPEATETQLWEGDPLLRPGEVALFATRRDPKRGWYTIVAQPHADRRVRDDRDGHRLVREFERATAATARRTKGSG